MSLFKELFGGRQIRDNKEGFASDDRTLKEKLDAGAAVIAYKEKGWLELLHGDDGEIVGFWLAHMPPCEIELSFLKMAAASDRDDEMAFASLYLHDYRTVQNTDQRGGTFIMLGCARAACERVPPLDSFRWRSGEENPSSPDIRRLPEDAPLGTKFACPSCGLPNWCSDELLDERMGASFVCTHCTNISHIPGGFKSHKPASGLVIRSCVYMAISEFYHWYQRHPCCSPDNADTFGYYGLWAFCGECKHRYTPSVLPFFGAGASVGKSVFFARSEESAVDLEALQNNHCPECGDSHLLALAIEVPDYIRRVRETGAEPDSWEARPAQELGGRRVGIRLPDDLTTEERDAIRDAINAVETAKRGGHGAADIARATAALNSLLGVLAHTGEVLNCARQALGDAKLSERQRDRIRAATANLTQARRGTPQDIDKKIETAHNRLCSTALTGEERHQIKKRIKQLVNDKTRGYGHVSEELREALSAVESQIETEFSVVTAVRGAGKTVTELKARLDHLEQDASTDIEERTHIEREEQQLEQEIQILNTEMKMLEDVTYEMDFKRLRRATAALEERQAAVEDRVALSDRAGSLARDMSDEEKGKVYDLQAELAHSENTGDTKAMKSALHDLARMLDRIEDRRSLVAELDHFTAEHRRHITDKERAELEQLKGEAARTNGYSVSDIRTNNRAMFRMEDALERVRDNVTDRRKIMEADAHVIFHRRPEYKEALGRRIRARDSGDRRSLEDANQEVEELEEELAGKKGILSRLCLFWTRKDSGPS